MVLYQAENGIAEIALNRPKANALHQEMLAELHDALTRAAADPEVRAIVLTSAVPRFFSAGFDVAEVFSYERPQMAEFLASYSGLAARLSRCEKPTLCAIPGHCFAGGAILALSCDFRILAEGDFGIALNEINVGVVLPPSVYRLAADVVGPGFARRMVLTGDPVPAAAAKAAGLVDLTAPLESLAEAARAFAASLAAKPAATYAGIKQSIRAARGQDSTEAGLLEFDVDVWFTPDAVERKRALVASLRK
jgi:enoyl-CoA hydratase/carnithine racemase